MGQRLFANPLQTTDTVPCCRKNFRHNLNVFFVSKNKANGRSDVKRKFAEKRTHGKGVCKYRSKRCFERCLPLQFVKR